MATRTVLDDALKDQAEYTFLSTTQEDEALSEQYGIQIITNVPAKTLLPAAFLKRFFRINPKDKNVRKVLDAYARADMVIDIWGIGFSDSIGTGTFRSCLFSGSRFLVAKILGKRVVKYTADLGPFLSRWNRFFSRIYFNHTVDLILARNEVTKERLVELGIKTPIKVCPDTAFLLTAHTCQLAEELEKEKANGRAMVGFSISHMAARQSGDPNNYIRCMAQLADYISTSINACIVLIPNELSPDASVDDMHYVDLVVEHMSQREQVVIVHAEKYTAQQLKGIIGKCDVVVAARYHSIVASLSQGIPVLAIGWHTKYSEILKLFDQDRYLCPVNNLDFDELRVKFDDLWMSRHNISQKIASNLPEIFNAILNGGEEVVSLIKKTRQD